MKLMILDGNSVINRAYFGVKPLTTRDGLYTHAVYGFLNILERMEKEESPDAVCVAFDLHGPTFRHARYEGYKANRHGMPEELAQQMPVMKQVLTAMNIPEQAIDSAFRVSLSRETTQAEIDALVETIQKDILPRI